ncbi:MAG: hypothetical protein CM15mP74_25350 [Halieaceae bacterium]|nr:MAG: hypothetical protein CM15mP74_25350 [Halieaceae bacterium]
MGQEAEQNQRAANLAPYQLSRPLLDLAGPDALYMHCLPAHRGEEISAELWMPQIPSSGRRRKTGFMRRKR